jgi:3-oxoacyl-[acyl-carrier-protein] synthase-3
MASRIIGVGGYLPKKVVTNDDLAKSIDTSDEWIRSRTGITKRHIAAPEEYSSHMGHQAALKAIKDAGIDQNDIDLIITCTNTPDNRFPSVANRIQGHLNLKNIPSFDLQAICSGFVYGLHVADGMIKSGKYKTILLICADKMSSLLDWQDRKTCVLFGDGAGAVILQQDNSNSGIIDSAIYSDGQLYDILYADGGIHAKEQSPSVQMDGKEVFKAAIEKMAESTTELLAKNNIKLEQIDHFVPHQANLRIINSLASRLGIDQNKIAITIDEHANCSASSIPLALSALKASKKIKAGDLLAFTAFGAGATWGSVIVRW